MLLNRLSTKRIDHIATLLCALSLHGFLLPPAEGQELATPSVSRALVFAWENAAASNEIVDGDGEILRICRVEPHGRARFGRYQDMDVTGGWFDAEDAGPAIADACRTAGSFSLEATITPAKNRTEGEATIVTMRSDEGDSNFSLTQHNERIHARVRTSMGVYPCDFGGIAAGKPVYVVVTYTAGRLTAFVDGKRASILDAEDADLNNWTAQPLLFGLDGDNDKGWSGAVEAVAFHCRALAPGEVADRFQRHQERVKDRQPATRAVVTARLLEASETPTVAEISPYRRALAVSTYEVQQVVAGACDGKKIQVAHWVILDRRVLPNVRVVGETHRLTIEPFEAHEQLDSERLISDSDEFDLPLYYDVDP